MNIRGKIREISLITVIFMIMVFVRIFLGSFSEYKKAEDLKKEGKLDFAVIHYLRSVRWYTPFNRFVKKSLNQLSSIAAEYSNNNEYKKELYLWEDLRSALYSVKSFYTPFKNYIDISDSKIARIRTEHGMSGLMAENESKSQTESRILAQLKKDNAPSAFFSIISLVGLTGWIASVLCFIFLVLGSKFYNRRRALYLGITFFAFYIIWLVGLYKA